MGNIVNILAEAGNEPCKVDVVLLHKTLLELPAKMYQDLYYMMQAEIEGQAHFISYLMEGSCECVREFLEWRKCDEEMS